MSCSPPETPAASTFTVSLSGNTVSVSPANHGTMKAEKTFHVVIADGSAVFPDDVEDAIVFDQSPSPQGVFTLDRKSDCYVTIDDLPRSGEKLQYGFKICVRAPGGGELFCSGDPTIVNDPEDA